MICLLKSRGAMPATRWFLAWTLLSCIACAQIAVPVSGLPNGMRRIENLDGLVVAFGDAGACLIDRGNTLPIDTGGLRVIRVVRERQDLWLLTQRGEQPGPALRVRGGKTKALPADDSEVSDLQSFGEDVWLSTARGAFRVRLDQAVRIPDQDLDVRSISSVAGAVWIATSNGCYRVSNDAAARIPDQDVAVRRVEEHGGRAWILCAVGAYEVDGDTVRGVLPVDTYVACVTEIDGKIWLGTSHGAWVYDGRSVRQVGPKDAFVSCVAGANGRAWIGSLDGILVYDGKTIAQVEGYSGKLESARVWQKRVWLMGTEGLHRVEGRRANLVGPRAPVDKIVETGRALYFRSSNEAWVTTEWGAKRIGLVGEVTDLEILTGTVWIATTEGMWILDQDVPRRVPDRALGAHALAGASGSLWVISTEGLYRVFPDVQLQVELTRERSLWQTCLETVGVDPAWVRGSLRASARYAGANGSLVDPGVKPEFTLTFPGHGAELPRMAFGSQSMSVLVKDQWGNGIQQTFSGYVVPPFYEVALIVVLTWLTIVAAIFVLVPYNRRCHRLINNRWFRWFGTCGVVPVILHLLTPARRHLLQRYLRSVGTDIRNWPLRYTPPSNDFQPRSFARLAWEHRYVIVEGESGAGKTCLLQFLSNRFANERVQPGAPFPVYLERPSGSPMREILEHVQDHGDITDRGLAQRLVRRGPFLILIDGIDQFSEDRQEALYGFASRQAGRNIVVVSSDRAPRQHDAHVVTIPSLAPIGQKNILCRRVESAELSKVLAAGVARAPDVYAHALNVHVLVEMARRDPKKMVKATDVPDTWPGLYTVYVAPVLEEWVLSGQPEYCERLYSLAFHTIRDHDGLGWRLPDIPDAMLSVLKRADVVRQGDVTVFRHELIHAYLAAMHFTRRWRDLLGELSAGGPWRSMMKMVIRELESRGADAAIGDMLAQLQTIAPELGEDLSLWLRHRALRVSGEAVPLGA